MKNTIKYIVLSILGISTSCGDFLEEENLSNVVADEYYTTAEGYESLVNASYATLRDVYSLDAWVYCAGTDMYVEGRNSQPEGISEYRTLNAVEGDNNVYPVTDYYLALYQSIQLVNTAISFNEKTELTNSLPIYLGEMKFLRAFYYFHLVQQFGAVSLVEERFTEVVVNFERTPAEEIYDFIITEMEESLALVETTAPAPGRVDKRVIRHFLSKVYLTRGYESFGAATDFSTAAQLADDAIAGESLSVPFEAVFFPGNEESAEIIFAAQFSAETILDPREDGHKQNYFFGPYLGGEGIVQGYPYRSYTLCPTMYVYDLFISEDSRFDASFMKTFYDRYYDYYEKNGDLASLGVQYYYPPAWEVTDTAAWRAADPAQRGTATIIPYSADWEPSELTNSDNATPSVKKFDDPKSAFSNNGTGTRSIFLARLGETYLLAAEAYLKSGDAGIAADRLNEVRRRAAVDGSESAMVISPASVDIDFILDERARELIGEYHRWFDLKRTGTLVERTELYNKDIRQWFDQGINPFLGNDGNLKILRPIPQKALDLNGAEVEQNPGY